METMKGIGMEKNVLILMLMLIILASVEGQASDPLPPSLPPSSILPNYMAKPWPPIRKDKKCFLKWVRCCSMFLNCKLY